MSDGGGGKGDEDGGDDDGIVRANGERRGSEGREKVGDAG